jgi:type IV secretory pathway VirB2 component (pilin)
MNKSKTIVFLILLVLVFSLGIVNFAYTQGTGTGTTFTNPLTPNTVEEVASSVLSSLKNIVAILAILFIVIGGLMYIFSAGDEKKIETAKKIWTGAVIGFVIVLIAPALLREIGTILGWSGTPATGLTLKEIIANVLKTLLSISGIIAIIFLVIGGLTYMTAYGEEKRIETGKKIITYSVIGIAIIMGALVIVNQISVLFG